MGCSSRGRKESGTAEQLTLSLHFTGPCWSLSLPPPSSLTSAVPASLLAPPSQETPCSLPGSPRIPLSGLDLSFESQTQIPPANTLSPLGIQCGFALRACGPQNFSRLPVAQSLGALMTQVFL